MACANKHFPSRHRAVYIPQRTGHPLCLLPACALTHDTGVDRQKQKSNQRGMVVVAKEMREKGKK